MLRLLFIFSCLVAVIGADAFAQAPTQQPPRPGQPPPPAQEEPPPAMAVPPSYRYDSRGRRDPFVNPVPKPPKQEVEIPAVRPPGLKGVLLAEAHVAGIVVSSQSPEMTRAMISAPGGKTYFARKGDALFDSVVKDIHWDAVVFELTSKDKEGKITIREVVRKISSTP
jgi:hypothetical protein